MPLPQAESRRRRGWKREDAQSLPAPQTQTQPAPEILENGEEAPGPGLSLDRMLSSSSSVSSLNSSTVRGEGEGLGMEETGGGRLSPISPRVAPA